MCGITGYISNSDFNRESMVTALQHRGPDAKGTYSDIAYDKKVFLGHTRLRIIDLSAEGDQPMATADGNIQLIYNGEVYNFQELKAKFLPHHQFKSTTDTEVVLHLYQQLGIDFVNELNGAFAMAIYDKNKAQLHLIRDRAGIKPLYYHYSNGTLVFGSEIKSILAAGIEAQVAESRISRFFVFKYTPGDDTLFKGIYRVPQAGCLTYDLATGDHHIEKYWQPTEDTVVRNMKYKDLRAMFYELLRDAVNKRLVADVPVSTFLSGGMDSSVIAHFLRNNTNIQHYCAGKDEADIKKEGTTSDFHYASKLARQWHLNLTEIPIGSDELTLEQLRTTLHYSDDLIADGSQIPSYLITKAASQQSRVVLTGMGADELFMGYAGHLITSVSLFLDRLPKVFSKPIAKKFGKAEAGKGKFKAYKRYLQKLGKYYQYPGYKYGIYSIVGDFENSLAICGGSPSDVTPFLEHYFSAGTHPFKALNEFEYENFMVKNLHYVDRTSMANSLESRVPFLDHTIINFAFNLDTKYKLGKGGVSKKIIADTFEAHVPEYIFNRRKAGFGMPLRSIFSQKEKINQLLDREFFGDFNYFSFEAIDQIIDHHINGREDNSSIIYALLSYQEWYKMYIQS